MRKKGQQHLYFVRCGSILVQRGIVLLDDPAALLGRFLPRLGPLACQRPFFLGRLLAAGAAAPGTRPPI